MMQLKKYALVAAVTLPIVYFAGCRNPVRIPAQFQLGDALGTFDVTAGEPTQKSGTGSLGGSAPNIGSGEVLLDPDDITFTPADGGAGKGTVTFQNGQESFTVIAGIAPIDELATVCDTPLDEYGPFTVTLNADFSIASIEPDSIELEQSTIDLINEGEFSICLTVESTIDGTVTIEALSFLLGF